MAWYDGNFVVVPGDHRRTRPKRGEIFQHHKLSRGPDGKPNPTDRYRLRCPRCGASSWYVGELMGTEEVPTFPNPLRCGCSARCGVTFRIRSGKAEEVDPVERAVPAISAQLEKMGVKRPPSIG